MEDDDELAFSGNIVNGTVNVSGITSSNITHNYAYDTNSAWISINEPSSEPTLIVNGRNVMQEIDEMRDALLLIKRDVNMEEKYPELKRLKDEYEAALEKYKTFDRIKDSK